MYPLKFLLMPVALLLSGCASINIDQSISQANQDAVTFTQGQLVLVQTAAQRASLERTADTLLKKPLSQDEAVQLALINSPVLQALLAEHWASAAQAAQSGRIANPVFSLLRLRTVDELSIERALTFGLLDLLTLPQRYHIAQQHLEKMQLRLAVDVIEQVTQVRQAWVKAVSAQQNLNYAQQVFESAQASAELANRMEAAGNFSKLQRARQQVFYAEAGAQLSSAQHRATANREELIRLLGLTEPQIKRLTLPERLPNLPQAPRDPGEISKAASTGRLDIRLAQSAFETAAKAQGLSFITSLTDIELTVRRDTKFDNTIGRKTTGRGVQISMRLPIFDWGTQQRDAMNAETLAQANRLEATVRAAGSNLRTSYSAYYTAYEIARNYRDEIVPLRKTIAQENLLRYNGMLIDVFELLGDAREQVASVMAALDAEQQFWLADAALHAALLGQPSIQSSNISR